MPDAFFASQKQRKRKRADSNGASTSKLARTSSAGRTYPNGRPRSSKPFTNGAGKGPGKGKGKDKGRHHTREGEDEELPSDEGDGDGMVGEGDVDDMDLRASDVDPNESAEEDAHETPAEKRLRLARMHLEGLKGEMLADGEFDAAEIDRELISARLRQEVAAHGGKLHLYIADSILLSTQPSIHPPTSTSTASPTISPPHIKPLRTKDHRLPLTCAIASDDCTALYTASKDGAIIRYSLLTGKQVDIVRKARVEKDKHASSSNGKKKGKGKGKDFREGLRDGEGGGAVGHTDEIWTLALSSDGRVLASGGKDRRVGVWDTSDEATRGRMASAGGGGLEPGLHWVRGFGGHRDGITSLSFRRGTHQLYTASLDRTLKLFDLAPTVMGYVETLFGHQDSVTGLASLAGETAVSCGARDRTVRFWKVVEESQLVFRGGGRSRVREVLEGAGAEADEDAGPEMGDRANGAVMDGKGKGKERTKEMRLEEGNIECVAMVDEGTFLSGGDTGTIAVWTTGKKKPIFTQALAHGMQEVQSATEGIIATPRWITALACLPYGDLVASGSWEGEVRLWKLDLKMKALAPVGSLSAPGFVNSLQLLSVPRGALVQAAWAHPSPPETADATADPPPHANGAPNGAINGAETGKTVPGGARKGEPAVLLVAGVSQEPRLARWMRVTEPGTVNGALVWALRTKATGAA